MNAIRSSGYQPGQTNVPRPVGQDDEEEADPAKKLKYDDNNKSDGDENVVSDDEDAVSTGTGGSKKRKSNPLESRRSAKKQDKKESKDSPAGTYMYISQCNIDRDTNTTQNSSMIYTILNVNNTKYIEIVMV